jgi:hypothetical protein
VDSWQWRSRCRPWGWAINEKISARTYCSIAIVLLQYRNQSFSQIPGWATAHPVTQLSLPMILGGRILRSRQFPISGGSICLNHYVRKAHSRRARTKNGDAKIARLCRHVSHYRDIEDTWLGVSPISTHGRCAMSERVTYLIFYWAPIRLIRDTR